MLCNDQANEWENDAELGKKIARAMNYVNSDMGSKLDNYGKVVECTHADNQSLVMLDGYTMFKQISGKYWTRDESAGDATLKLLKDTANNLGYRLVKKAERL